MIIDLSEKFTMYDERGRNKLAWVEDGILKLKVDASFRKAMYELTYELKGRNVCEYCGKTFLDEDMTLDHMIPQERGGPTITNNLVPSCRECNSKKSNMTAEQYIKYKNLSGTEKKKYFESFKEYVKCMKKNDLLELPDDWISKKEVSEILVRFDFSQEYKKSQYRKVEKFYNEYGHLPKPILVDKKGFLLDGFISLMFAKDNNLRNLSVMVLENVEVII